LITEIIVEWGQFVMEGHLKARTEKKMKTFHFISEAPLLHIHWIILIHLLIILIILVTDFQVLCLDIRCTIVIYSRQVPIVPITAIAATSNWGLG